jgi:hypothetical protein
MGSVDVTFINVPIPILTRERDLQRRGLDDSIVATSDPWSGLAKYSIMNDNGPAGLQSWEVQPVGCSPILASGVITWSWGIDCSSSTVTLDKTSAYKDEVVTLSGQYSPSTGATIGNGATVLISGIPAGSQVVNLNPDGSFTWTISYTAANPEDVWDISVTFIQSYDPCSKDGPDLSITWMDRPPSCVEGASSMILSTNSPDIDDNVLIIITALDGISGNPLPNLPYDFHSTTRQFLSSSYLASGFLDVNGQAVITYPNSGFGAGVDAVQAHVGSDVDGCDISDVITWTDSSQPG